MKGCCKGNKNNKSKSKHSVRTNLTPTSAPAREPAHHKQGNASTADLAWTLQSGSGPSLRLRLTSQGGFRETEGTLFRGLSLGLRPRPDLQAAASVADLYSNR